MSSLSGRSYGGSHGGRSRYSTPRGYRVKAVRPLASGVAGLAAVAMSIANKRGSFLVAARKASLDYLIRRFNDQT